MTASLPLLTSISTSCTSGSKNGIGDDELGLRLDYLTSSRLHHLLNNGLCLRRHLIHLQVLTFLPDYVARTARILLDRCLNGRFLVEDDLLFVAMREARVEICLVLRSSGWKHLIDPACTFDAFLLYPERIKLHLSTVDQLWDPVRWPFAGHVSLFLLHVAEVLAHVNGLGIDASCCCLNVGRLPWPCFPLQIFLVVTLWSYLFAWLRRVLIQTHLCYIRSSWVMLLLVAPLTLISAVDTLILS